MQHKAIMREGIHTGYVCEQEWFTKRYERITGNARKFDPRVFEYSPCGSRLLLVRDEQVTKLGSGLIIPDNTTAKNPPGSGYVIAVGDMVGQGTSPHPHGIRLTSPESLLYKRVIFGMFSGVEYITQPYHDGGFCTEYWINTDRDLFFVDWSVEDKLAEVEFESKLQVRGLGAVLTEE